MTANQKSEVAKRAYAIWEKEGRPDGKASDHWARAETELAAKPAKAPPVPKAKKAPSAPKRAKPAAKQ